MNGSTHEIQVSSHIVHLQRQQILFQRHKLQFELMFSLYTQGDQIQLTSETVTSPATPSSSNTFLQSSVTLGTSNIVNTSGPLDEGVLCDDLI
jgi:hypothetical protein